MELDTVMRTTFAARAYTGEPLPDATLHAILDRARFAPSGGNRQGTRIIVVRDAATREAIARLAEPVARRYAAQRAAGETPFTPAVPSRVTEEDVARTPVPESLVAPYRTAAAVLVFAVDLKAVAAMDKDLDRVGLVAGGSVFPLVWNVLLAARDAGFGGTITTMPIAREPELKALLGVPGDHAVAALVPLGRPVTQLTRLRRKPVREIATRERFDGPPFDVADGVADGVATGV
jgi:nitroreductase